MDASCQSSSSSAPIPRARGCRMAVGSLFVRSFIVGVLAVLPMSAVAHDATNYFWNKSGNGILRFRDTLPVVPWAFDTGFPDNAKRDRVRDAANKWDGVPSSSFDYDKVPDVVQNDSQVDCSTEQRGQDDSSVHFDHIDSQGDVLAATTPCWDEDDDTDIEFFQMIVDHDETWYSGNDNVPDGEWDLQSIATHEFGHAMGGWHPSSPESHFDAQTNAALCTSSASTNHTMCTPANTGALGQKGWRTLEEHDKDTVDDGYPG